MLEYRLQATLKAYTSGIFPTKISELPNDVPFLETVPQTLTDSQKRQALINQSATEILSENFVRFDTPTMLTPEQQEQFRENIGVLSEQETADALDDFKKTFVNAADLETIVKKETEDPDVTLLKAIAIKDFVLDGTERIVVPQDIVNIEDRIGNAEKEIGRISARGGNLTPYNFGWDAGTISSLQIGSQFEEQDPTNPLQKRMITVVEEGQDDYPEGNNISVSDAKVKAHRLQVDLMAWAAEDIWNETYSKYQEDPLPFVLEKGKALTLLIEKGINPTLPIGHWESIATDANGYEYGLWVTDRGDGQPQINFGKFKVFEGSINEQETPQSWLSFGTIDEMASGVVNYWNNEEESSDITLHELVSYEYDLNEGEEAPTSGIDWTETLLYWKGHSPLEIINGTRCINKFNGWIWEIANTPETSPSVFSWGLADIGEENIGYAQDTTAGLVKTKSTIDDNPYSIYGIKLDEQNRMYVDRLGEDMSLKEDKARFGQEQPSGSPSTMFKDGANNWQVRGFAKYFNQDEGGSSTSWAEMDGYTRGFSAQTNVNWWQIQPSIDATAFLNMNHRRLYGDPKQRNIIATLGVTSEDHGAEIIGMIIDKNNLATLALFRDYERHDTLDASREYHGLARRGDIIDAQEEKNDELFVLYNELYLEGWIGDPE